MKPRTHCALIACLLGLLTATRIAQAQPGPPPPPPPLPPAPVPAENPITEPKRVLGKILFWDEQLSSDNTISCGSCHKPAFGGTDPRIAINPGLDGLINTPDDKRSSPGVIHCDEDEKFLIDDVFGLNRQITPRAANPAIMAMYAPNLFWDGRATSEFTDPQTGLVSIASGGALESQAVGPIVSSVEMGHEARDWTQVANKLSVVQPMILAGDIPADMAAALTANPSYPELFEAAFGDTNINAERIAFAIATYERTLVANQTPFDLFLAGDQNAMTPQQVQGWNALRPAPCLICHTPPLFSDNSFRNIGLRPLEEDTGRQEFTGDPVQRGQFKVPTLRNVGLKTTFMHNGQFNTLPQVIGFYANPAVQFPNNKSPILPVALPPQIVPDVVEFITNGLTDPRVANETFPFDRPNLYSDRPAPNPSLVSEGVAGSGGETPQMIAVSPPNLLNLDFKVGVMNALGGAQALVAISEVPPVDGELIDATLDGPVTLEGVGAGEGYGTYKWPIDELAIASCDIYLQWRITDPAAPGGVALSPVAHLRMIPYLCGGDMNCDGAVNGDDIAGFVQAMIDPAEYMLQHPDCSPSRGDMNDDQVINMTDANLFIAAMMD
ncbi:MAG TPA: cytochrome c peroxidase [Phycisphaerae bacterium]|nr:cytochrome c peroxidase [Phycisphaerae bacterium]HRW55200.1 cytochrome c peroxidase [Phycisphaerae bacterium]